MRFLLAVLFALSFTLVAAQGEDCLLTQDDQTKEITTAEMAEFKPTFRMPEVGDQSVCLVSNTTRIFAVTRELDVRTRMTTTQSSNGELVRIISIPQIPSAGVIDCVQVPCPGTFGDDVVCWKCKERYQAPPPPHSARSTADGSLTSPDIGSVFAQMQDTSRITQTARYIRYGDTTCPEPTTGTTGTITSPTCEPCSTQAEEPCPEEKEFGFNRVIFILILVALFVGGCICACMILIICRKATK